MLRGGWGIVPMLLFCGALCIPAPMAMAESDPIQDLPTTEESEEFPKEAPSVSADEPEVIPELPAAVLPPEPGPTVRPRIAILPFVQPYEAHRTAILSSYAISDVLTTELARTGRFTIVERQGGLDALVDNKEAENVGYESLDAATSARFYELTKADYLLVGRISTAHFEERGSGTAIAGLGLGEGKKEYNINVDFRLVRAHTGEVAFATRGEGSSKRGASLVIVGNLMAFAKSRSGNPAGQYDLAIVAAVENFVDQLEATDLFPIRAGIQGITEDDEVYIDLGQGSGVYPGLLLEVRRLIVAKDAKTGKVLGQRLSALLGTLRVKEVTLDSAVCSIESGIAESDCIVQLPPGVSLGDFDALESQKDKAKEDKKNQKNKRE